MIYLVAFFSSYALLRCSEKKVCGIRRVIAIVLAILLPSALAGLRDFSIGTDIEIYGNAWFENAVKLVSTNNFAEYIKWAVASSIGALYASINYLVAIFTPNAHWFYFILNLLTTGLVYKAAYDNRDIADVPFAMLVYYLLYYNQSLNILRQSLALALTLCAFRHIRDKNLIKAVLWMVLAYLSHSSAVVVIALYVIYQVLNSQMKQIAKALIMVGLVASVIGFPYLLDFSINIGILSSRYEMYGTMFRRGGGYIRIFLLCIPTLVLLYGLMKSKVYKKEIEAMKSYSLVSAVLSLLAFRMTYITRIAYYFDIVYVISIPMVCENMKYKFSSSKVNVNRLLIVVYLLAYWLFVYVYKKSGETFPYIFFR